MTLGVNPDPRDRLPMAEPNVAYILAVIDNANSRQAGANYRRDPVYTVFDILAQRGDKGGINYKFGDAPWRNWSALSDAAVKRLLSLKPFSWAPAGGWIGSLSPLVASMALDVEKTQPDDALPPG